MAKTARRSKAKKTKAGRTQLKKTKAKKTKAKKTKAARKSRRRPATKRAKTARKVRVGTAAATAVLDLAEEAICTAPDDGEAFALGLEAVSPVNTKLTLPATGLYGYTDESKRFGVADVIRAVEAIGRDWNALHSDAPIGVGNISKNGGGALPPHASHKKGIDVDVRPIRTDKKKEPVTFTDAKYSRSLTQELVNVIRENDVLDVQMIFFNDPNVSGVQPQAGHHNHLHVRFKV